jgi:HlyD family secretion protein
LTQVDIPNASSRLLPGMFVYVDFKIAPSGVRWRLPATALIFDAQGTRVATVGDGNIIQFRQVELGRDFGDTIDVQGGLHGTETIVAQPMVSLKEGQVVRPLAYQATR